MNNVHPSFLAMVRKRLPAGTEVVNIVSDSERKSTITVVRDEVTKQLPMPKVYVNTYLRGRGVELTVEEGITLEAAMREVSEKYRLFLLPDVDYKVNDAVINFGEEFSVQYQVKILDTSVSLWGDFTITLRNKALCCRSTDSIDPDLTAQRIRLLLAGEVFDTYDIIVVGGGGDHGKLLTSAADFIRSIPGIEPGIIEDLLVAEIVGIVNDGISNIAVTQLPDDSLLFIRFKFIQASEEPPLDD